MSATRQQYANEGLGRRPAPPRPAVARRRIIIANGDRVHAIPVRPGVLLFAALGLLTLLLGYLAATAYIVYRDDMFSASIAHQTRVQRVYEDRIAVLRGEIDKIKSRQLLDQQSVEEKLDRLYDKQLQLDSVNLSVATVINAARETGLRINTPTAVPQPRPERAETASSFAVLPPTPIAEGESAPVAKPRAAGNASPTPLLRGFAPDGSPASAGAAEDPFDILEAGKQSALRPLAPLSELISPQRLASISGELDTQFNAQLRVIDTITIAAEAEAVTIRNVMDRLGVAVAESAAMGETGLGGPLVELENGVDPMVVDRVERAERALQELGELRLAARTLPISRPIAGAEISSGFGRRMDPFLRRPAMHTGIDFRAPRGTTVRAAGDGVVVAAGRKGGYGKMVEIDHGNGLITRYAHLSRYNVKQGDRVSIGDTIGRVGSTGRSTGPHLHFETRRGEKPVNPREFLAAGSDLKGVLGG